jgi:hypothetical protein
MCKNLKCIIRKQTFFGGGIIRYGKYNKLADGNFLMVRVLGFTRVRRGGHGQGYRYSWYIARACSNGDKGDSSILLYSIVRQGGKEVEGLGRLE